MLNNLKSKLDGQNLRELYNSSLMFISGGANTTSQQNDPSSIFAHNHESTQNRLQLKTDVDEDDDLIGANDNNEGTDSARSRSGLLSSSRNYFNEEGQKTESINLRAQPRSLQQPSSNQQRVLVDDFGLFSDLELRPTAFSASNSTSSTRNVNETKANNLRKLPTNNKQNHSHSHSHNNHSHSHSHSHNTQRHSNYYDDDDDDVAMLNPNYDADLINDDHEQIVENNHLKLIININGTESGARGCSSNSSSIDDHCHVSVSLENKDRNKTVWYKLITVFILCVMFMIGEIIGGILAKSISIQTDAAHMAADIAGFFFSILAIYVSEKEPTRRMSFGYYRSEVLGALFSILIIWLLTGVLVYLAIVRVITHDFEIESTAMVVTASCGVVFNIIMFVILHTNRCFGDQLKHHGHSHSGDGHGHGHGHSHGHNHSHDGAHGHSHGGSHGHSHATPKFTSASAPVLPINDNYISESSNHTSAYLESDEVDIIDSSCNHDDHGQEHGKKDEHGNINLRAAAIHVIGDFIQSIGVLIASLIIYFKPEYKIADPICTFIFSALVMATTAPIIKDIFFVLMEGLPIHLNYNLIAADLCSLNNVKNAHNLHIWCLTLDKFVLAVHLVTEKNIDTQQVLRDANNMLRTKYKIERTIIQVEYFVDGMDSCPQCRLPK